MKPKDLREQIQQKLSAQSIEECSRLSALICRRHLTELVSLGLEFGEMRVGFYWPLKKEVQIQEVIRFYQFHGATLGFVRMLDAMQMTLVQLEDPFSEREWDPATIGVRNPSADCPEMNLSECDLIYVPGILFNDKGERIGRGKGYYDRFLSGSDHALRVSLGYDFQLLSGQEFEQAEWDQKVDWIQTESQQVRTELASSKLAQLPKG